MPLLEDRGREFWAQGPLLSTKFPDNPDMLLASEATGWNMSVNLSE